MKKLWIGGLALALSLIGLEASTAYFCQDGKIIPNSKACDGKNDCDLGEDEFHCNCGWDLYSNNDYEDDSFYEQLPTSKGITALCDGVADCENGYDESSCSELICDTSFEDQFARCLRHNPDCEEYEGEIYCMTAGDFPDEIECDWLCDGKQDCAFGEDEWGCDFGATAPECELIGGSCQDNSESCGGDYLTGLYPGAANIQCCYGDSSSEEVESGTPSGEEEGSGLPDTDDTVNNDPAGAVEEAVGNPTGETSTTTPGNTEGESPEDEEEGQTLSEALGCSQLGGIFPSVLIVVGIGLLFIRRSGTMGA